MKIIRLLSVRKWIDPAVLAMVFLLGLSIGPVTANRALGSPIFDWEIDNYRSVANPGSDPSGFTIFGSIGVFLRWWKKILPAESFGKRTERRMEPFCLKTSFPGWAAQFLPPLSMLTALFSFLRRMKSMEVNYGRATEQEGTTVIKDIWPGPDVSPGGPNPEPLGWLA